jgi:carbonic anhydrase
MQHPGETSAAAVLAYAVENLGIENIVVVGH